MNTNELLIANGQLVADTLRHLADNEIDSDYFAITSTSENGTEIEHELVITDYALQAASTVEALVEALESAQKSNAFLKDQLSELANFNPDWDKLEASYEIWREIIVAELLAAKGRIAELEARTVNLPKASQVKLASGEYVHAWPAYTVDSAIRAAGINLTVEG